ncbi:MAG: TolC family protein [Xanthomonadales bacterium]|nr:TolC family protein [Xanthomonadales bacterium]
MSAYWIRKLAGLMLLGWACNGAAQVLTLERVLHSARIHTPTLLEAQAEFEMARGDRIAADGRYDINVSQENYNRFSGFYDGKISSTKVSQRFLDYNSEVYAAYRVSDGDFPIYEDEFFTNGGGEIKLGVVFSLLQNRDFDSGRFALLSGRLKQDAAALNMQLQRVSVQFEAMTRYKEWLAAGLTLRAYQRLLDVAQERDQAMRKRVAGGDLAEIFLVESQQNILKRETLVNEAQRRFIQAAQRLSFYYRDTQGYPIVPESDEVPKRFPQIQDEVLRDIQSQISRMNELRPELLLLENEIEKAQAELQLGENLARPSWDVRLETARDFGDGSITRSGTDVIVGMKFSLPLERSLAKGRIHTAKAKLKRLQYKQQRVSEQLLIEVNSIINDIRAAKRFMFLAAEEQIQATTLQSAEQIRFNNGDSDFFVLNLREERAADAAIRNIQAQARYFISAAAYYAATVQLDQFQLQAQLSTSQDSFDNVLSVYSE